MRRWQRRCCFHPCVQHTILSPENLEKTIITAANQDATVKEEGKCGRNEGEITSQRCTDLIDTVGCCGGSQVSQSASAFYNHRWSSWGGQRRGKFAGNSRKRARSCIAYLQFDHYTTTNLVPLLSLSRSEDHHVHAHARQCLSIGYALQRAEVFNKPFTWNKKSWYAIQLERGICQLTVSLGASPCSK